MANRCQVTGREPRSGKNVSFSHKRNPRWFKPNIQTKKYWLASEVTIFGTIDKVSVFTTKTRLRIATLSISDESGSLKAK